MIWIWVFMVFVMLSVLYLLILGFRNDKVYYFRKEILEKIYTYNMTLINETLIAQRIPYECMGSYKKMVFMFWRPLEIKRWFSADIVNKINS